MSLDNVLSLYYSNYWYSRLNTLFVKRTQRNVKKRKFMKPVKLKVLKAVLKLILGHRTTNLLVLLRIYRKKISFQFVKTFWCRKFVPFAKNHQIKLVKGSFDLIITLIFFKPKKVINPVASLCGSLIIIMASSASISRSLFSIVFVWSNILVRKFSHEFVVLWFRRECSRLMIWSGIMNVNLWRSVNTSLIAASSLKNKKLMII